MLDAEATTAVALSLKVAATAVVLSVPFGIAMGWLLARRRFRGRLLLDVIVHLPLVLPPVVTGYALLELFGARGPVGQWLQATLGVTLAFRWTGAALASAVMGFPLMVRAIRLAIENVDVRLENAARTLGASPWRVFRDITLPLAWPGIVAGSVLAFAKALGEFGATITFVSSIPGETQTLPSAIYALLQVPGQEHAVAVLAGVSVALSFVGMLAAEWLLQRQSEEAAV